VGEKGIFDCSLNGNFSRGSRALFAASLDHLGEIKMITVSTTEDSPSLLPTDQWLLEKIVLSVPSRDDIEFVCNEWIGNSGHPGDYDGDDCVNDKIVLFPTSPGSLSADYEWNDELHLSLGRSGVPAEEKINRGHKSVVRKNNGYAGEDAYFISYGTRRERAKEKRAFDFSMANHYYLGVADGVGMWRKEGVDSALYSQHLLHSAREVIGAHNNPDPYKVLSEAWENTTIVHGVKGSCTVCLFRVSPDGWVDGVQVGDAGLRVVRDGKIVYRTSEQEHLFGFPYQLGHISTTKPQDCIRHRFQALPGDVLVMGSDGLFDNVSDRSMASTIRDFCNLEVQNRSSVKPFNGDELSRKLVTMAYLNSVQKEQDTPWSRAAQKEWDVPISGGKEDDVVAVVARIESR
jgi:protein phosphatase PTC7